MRIGITERGDAALDLTWSNKIMSMDGSILITKNISNRAFLDKIRTMLKLDRIIIHATITGWGGTELEPNVPTWERTVETFNKIHTKMQEDRLVLRVDPIIPAWTGLERACAVIKASTAKRVRISFLDLYPHVIERMKSKGIEIPWDGFHAPEGIRKHCLQHLCDTFPERQFEICGEPQTTKHSNLEYIGCISQKDLKAFGISDENQKLKGQRATCGCLACKTEMLNQRGQCAHSCLYCYWK